MSGCIFTIFSSFIKWKNRLTQKKYKYLSDIMLHSYTALFIFVLVNDWFTHSVHWLAPLVLALLQVHVLIHLSPACLLSQLFRSFYQLFLMFYVLHSPLFELLFFLSKETLQLLSSCSLSCLFFFILFGLK